MDPVSQAIETIPSSAEGVFSQAFSALTEKLADMERRVEVLEKRI